MPVVDYGVLPGVITVVYCFILYFSIKNNAIFDSKSYNQLVAENKSVVSTSQNRTALNNTGSYIDEEKTTAIIHKIEEALYVNSIYKNSTLQLSDLAQAIDEQEYVTSRILNAHFNKTFFDIINELRVIEAQRLLQSFDNKKEKIETIAYESGFNSRASFYRSFKKITGKSPTEIVSTS